LVRKGLSAGTGAALGGVRNRMLLLAMLVGVLGCQGPRATLPGLPQSERDVNALRLHRLDQAARRLGVTGIEVALSRRPEPGAWAWPKGPIRVSGALVDLVDDDELAAAIAHELGHLQADGAWQGPLAALEGSAGPDVEARADELGCRLLAWHGIPPAASVRLVEKLGASLRGGWPARIARARATCLAIGTSCASAARP
jgi:hypothetical protein